MTTVRLRVPFSVGHLHPDEKQGGRILRWRRVVLKNGWSVGAGDVVGVKEKLYVNFLTVFGVYSAKYTITIIGI